MTAILTPEPQNLTDPTEIIPVESASVPAKLTFKQELQIFTSTFFAVFLAELGDKTQMTTLLMSAQSQTPWIVFLGAGAALIGTSLVGVLVGRWLSRHVSVTTLETATGAILLLIAAMLVWDVVQL
ncbi:TMEM165/GDT1 family protein [Microcoleus sp. FACHB-1515]|uniref:TMEM165/GDT1 family protein n=1 Tax=Cyanophyceae TaxID=3028117 RepID=UPI001688A203|nr:TMEM165/GDT1 family protein [Microcoleus sp. FACHB-1515]MBD2091942.1 TMEM165/GDT1 family protein [Microcoleus sp. FACHB-1515]